jgi:hypothetical protein
MRKFNLDFIGEIVSSPKGMCSWSGTTVSFWGKFNEEGITRSWEKFERERLIEAIPLSEERPSKDHYHCKAFQVIPEEFLFLNPMEEFFKEQREERSQEGLTLGELIDTLQDMPPDTKVSNLTYPHSYRGYYEDLAFEKESGTRLASELLSECKSALHRPFYGYKGGEYGMNMETSVWVAEYGCTGERLIGLGPDGAIETKFLN